MRRTLGVIFSGFPADREEDCLDNLAFVMRAVGASPKEIRKRIPYVLGGWMGPWGQKRRTRYPHRSSPAASSSG